MFRAFISALLTLMPQNSRCSILFHCVLQKHERKGVMTWNHMVAD
jgi:hypothetical protein